uniref:XPO5 n=1 Tax=Mytilus galloprovincialis TaxID=29158 RepID=A0A140H130_MYTGA|nr:XPO5 [Mytilus galloprovincialis]
MESQVSVMVPTLVSAVETVMNPIAAQQDRQSAQQILEEFKESSPYCVQCGLKLSQYYDNPVARHFGLQLLEHSIKFRWNSFTEEEKEQLKKSSLEIIEKGTLGIIHEQIYIKDVISRIIVEIIKREWPQLWPTLLADLYNLCQHGATQTELVLKIYLRLVEDVVSFMNLPTTRRREVLQGLTGKMEDLFEFFLNLLEKYRIDFYKTEPIVSDGAQWTQYHNNLEVSRAVLSTLTGYLDWVNMSHIFSKDLLHRLCLMLSNKHLQLSAAECLLLIVTRKGKVEERKPLLILFSENAMSLIWNSAIEADHTSKEEHYYLFLKRLCQVIIELGKQLCAMWGPVVDVKQPDTFNKYLEAVLAFTQHPGQMISSYTLSLWCSFLQHNVISQDEILLSFIPRLFETASKTLYKVGFPSQNNSPSCDYSRLEFDCDEEFNMFFAKYRSEWSNVLRLSTILNPGIAFQFANQWLQSVLSKGIDSGNDAANHCTLSSPSFLEWDAASCFLESVMSRLFVSKAENKPELHLGVDLLHSVLSFEANDPLVLSSLLSCISALFPYLSQTPQTLPVVLKKIFSAVTFSQDGQTKATRSRAVKNVRQHACSIVVKISKQYTDLIFPVFDQLYTHIKEIGRDSEQLSQMEKCILMEALILVSNKFCNFEKQSAFIDEMLKPVKDLWISQDFKEAFWSTEKFMSYIGVDRAPVEPSSADTCGINRSHISCCINTILAVMKRSKWPDNPQEASNGGFVMCSLQDGTVVYRNPATSHVSLLLENLLYLMKTMNALYHPDYLQGRHPEFTKSYEMNEIEKLTILGIPPPCVDLTQSVDSKKPVDRMQIFLTTTHDNSCHILGNAGQCLGYEFYKEPNLSQLLLNTVFTNLQNLPDFRTKLIIRVFVKPYVQHCPKDCYSTAVIPILEVLCPTFYQILSTKWQLIIQRTSEEDDNKESQEVVDDHLTRQLTKEYLDLLVNVTHDRKTIESSDDIGDEEVIQTPANPREETLSLLGQMCLKNESIYPSLLMFVYSCLSWSDTSVANRATGLCYSTLKQFHADQNITNDLALYFFRSVLKGLHTHGQHEELQSSLLLLGLQTYELLRPQYPELTQVLLQVPNCTEDLIQGFDVKLLQPNNQKQFNEKKKKDAFKKLVADIIGKSIGQMFKREIHYRDLPTLFTVSRKKHLPLDSVEPHNMGLCDLFTPSNGAPTFINQELD